MAVKVVTGLLARGLLAEIEAGPGDPIWRDAGGGRGITLVATDAAQDALRIEAQTARVARTTARVADEPATTPRARCTS